MSKAHDIIDALVTQLKNSSALSSVDDGNIHVGIKDNITMFPCIIIESSGGSLLAETLPYERRVKRISISGFVNSIDKEGSLTELLDLENNVFIAISSDTKLGLNDVVDVKLIEEVEDFSQFPIRGFTIVLEVQYQQVRLTRV